MNNSESENLGELVAFERQRQKRIGYSLWIFILIVGGIGASYWGWMFFLLVLIAGFAVGSFLGVRVGTKIERATGLGIDAQMTAWNEMEPEESHHEKESNVSHRTHSVLGKMTGIESKVKWSQRKMMQVYGPPIYGDHNIFVDGDFNVAAFLPKGDKTLHVLAGDIVKANRWLKFDSNGNQAFDKKLSETAHEWKINPNTILYRGRMFPPEQPFYKGKVLSFKEFDEEITEEWLISMKNEFMGFMHKS